MKTNKDNLPFGKRYGFEPIEVPFQISSIDKTFRIELWNAYFIFIQSPIESANDHRRQISKTIEHLLWIHFFKKPYDDFPRYDSQFGSFVRKFIETAIWYKVYEFFEFVFRNIEDEHEFQYSDYQDYVNDKLKSNNSAYSLVNNKFIPITNEVEINEIKRTQELSIDYALTGIQEHLNVAVELLSKKPNPDYRNSIKESISMVEVISRIIEPTENTLGKALTKLIKNNRINPTLKAGFEKLYAYTNDKNGIRHALMSDQNIDLEDAKFFLVSCSAFTNYLIEKAIKERILTRIT
jgi:hypothetical protein